jgi:RimJ/RimL family protein N-acetyltransferase
MGKLDFSATSERLRIRPLEARDLPMTRAWRNASRVWFEKSEEISEADHLRWFKHYIEDDSQAVLVAEDRIFGIQMGQVAIRNVGVDPVTSSLSAEFGRLLVDPSLLGRGIATEMLQAILKSARQLEILELRLEVFHDNAPAIRVYEKLGFHEVFRTSSPRPLIAMIRRDWELWDASETERIDAYWASSGFERAHRVAITGQAMRLIGDHASILEVGCGTGRMMAAMIDADPSLLGKFSGCDISPAMLKKARDRFPSVPFHAGDIFQLPFENGKFDVVLAFEVLSHLPSIAGPLREMARVAKKKIIFTVWERVDQTAWDCAAGFSPIHRAAQERDVLAVLPNAKPVGPVWPYGVRLWECSR